MFRRAIEAWHDSDPLRKAFGTREGLALWNALRSHYKLPPGTRFCVRVPILKEPIWLRAGNPSDLGTFHQILTHGQGTIPLPSHHGSSSTLVRTSA